MKITVKKSLCVLLLFSFILQFSAFKTSSIDGAKPNALDPYTLMYNSNEKLAEMIEEIPEFNFQAIEAQPVKIAAGFEDQASQDAKNGLTKEKKEEAAELARAGDIDRISELNISDEIKNEIIEFNEEVKEDRYIIKYSEGSGDISELLAKDSGTVDVRQSKRSGNTELLILSEKMNPKELADTLKASGADEYIDYIQPDFKMEYASLDEEESLELDSTSDTGESTTPTEIPDSTEDVESGDYQEVIVAVIDTGIDISHTGLDGYIWSNPDEIADNGVDDDANGYIDDVTGWNFYGDNNSVYNNLYPLQSAHGTHVSGIIASQAEDFNVRIMPLKVFGDSGAYTSDIIDAIEYAEANGAKVVNCSFGSIEYNFALEEAIEASDMLFIAAVGNARSNLEDSPIYPACFDLSNVISVTSANADGGLSYYSNYSSSIVDLAALGRDVYSTLPNGEYGNQSGTSMSAAQVSAIAAAVLCVQDDLDSAGLKYRLISTSDMLSNLQNKVIYGRQINLDNAVNDLEQTAVVQNSPEDDFDVDGYAPTQSELYELYTSSGDVVQVVGGYGNTLVLKEDGTVWAWGNNGSGQCGNDTTSLSETLTQVIGLTNVAQIAAENNYSLAVKSDGTVWAWGYNNSGQLGDGQYFILTPMQISGLANVTSISAGFGHILALKSNGTVWACGSNFYGELGDGTTTDRTTPVQVSTLTNVTSIAAGFDHSLAVKSDGTVWAWGGNNFGQLGDGTTTYKTTPVQVSNITGAASISAGYYYTLAVKSDGTVWSWGNNDYGKLGDGTTTYKTTPVQTSNLSGISSIVAGDYHSLAVKSDGTVWSWGNNDYGQLGDGTTTYKTTPVQVNGLTDITGAASGELHSSAVKSDGTVWAWGYNDYGQLGDGTPVNVSTPVQVNGLTDITGAASGEYHSLALETDQTVWSWGLNDSGQLGDGTTTNKTTPVQVSGLADVIGVAKGNHHSLAVKSNGTAWAWGYNAYGQLGDGTTTDRLTPVQVSGLTGVINIASGFAHGLALKSDGTVWAWGRNNNGQLGDGTTTDHIIPEQISGLTDIVSVSAGFYNSLALKADGTVWAWGRNDNGQLGDGTTTNRTTPVQVSSLTNVVVISAGDFFGLAVKSDGTVWSWGNNGSGQLGDGTYTSRTTPVQASGLTGVVSAAAGHLHSLALKTDKTVWAWGDNDNGQLGEATDYDQEIPIQMSVITDALSIAAGGYHSLAVKSDGTIWSCGNDSYGQLGDSRLLSSNIPFESLAYIEDVIISPDMSEFEQLSDENAYLAANVIGALGGTITGVSDVLSLDYEVLNDNEDVIQSGEITLAENWSIPDLGLFMGENTLRITADCYFQQDVELSLTIYNTNPDNMTPLALDEDDDDEDGLPNYYEDYLGTDPEDADSDDDDLSDYVEAIILQTDPLSADSDDNSVADGLEDFDDDGLTNLYEVNNGTDPLFEDSDNDGLSDGDEVNTYSTDPADEDSDDDGVKDGKEVELGTNPLTAQTDFEIQKTVYDGVEVIPSVDIELEGDQVDTLSIMLVDADPLITEDVPGYTGPAYEFYVEGSFDSAEISFEFDPDLLLDIDFDPVIYFFDEETQSFVEATTTVSSNVASAVVTHFSTYILLNRTDYDDWRAELLTELIGVDTVTDDNDDGIADDYMLLICEGLLRAGGINPFDGVSYYQIQQDSDYDEDGVINGGELNILGFGLGVQLIMLSDPKLLDSDNDGLNDLDDPNPLVWDVCDRDLAMFAALCYETKEVYNSGDKDNIVGRPLESGQEFYFLSYADLTEVSPSWEAIDQKMQPISLFDAYFDATTYKNGNKVVIAFRGTDDGPGEMAANILGYGIARVHPEEPYAEEYASEIAEKFPSCDIYITGHSLGGYLAQVAACHLYEDGESSRVKRIAYFNGMGLTYSVNLIIDPLLVQRQNALEDYLSDSKLVRYRIAGDVVSPIGYHVLSAIVFEPTAYAIENATNRQEGYMIYLYYTHETDSFFYYLRRGTRMPQVRVYTAEDLYNVRYEPSLNYIQMNDIDLSGYGNWSPIGTWANPFTGQYDGDNHNITGMTITNLQNTTQGGLFGTIMDDNNRTLIQNVNIDVDIYLEHENYYEIGALVGFSGGVDIINCNATGTIAVIYTGDDTDDSIVGGLIGCVFNYDESKSDMYITDCSSTVTIQAYECCWVGGLIGFMDSWVDDGIDIYVEDCYIEADIIGLSLEGIENQINYGFGGLAGYGGCSNISKCYFTGTILCECGVGGLFGECYDNIVTDCYAIAAIDVPVDFPKVYDDPYWSYYGYGGMAGYGDGTYINCYTVCTFPTYDHDPDPDNHGFINQYEDSYTNVTSCYFNSSLTSFIDYYATGKTTAQLKSTPTFSGWNFSTIWDIDAGINSGYPYLRSAQ